MGDTIQSLIADVIEAQGFSSLGYKECVDIAREIVAQPEIAALIDLAADANAYLHDVENGLDMEGFICYTLFDVNSTPEQRAQLTDWRANRAEQEPTP